MDAGVEEEDDDEEEETVGKEDVAGANPKPGMPEDTGRERPSEAVGVVPGRRVELGPCRKGPGAVAGGAGA